MCWVCRDAFLRTLVATTGYLSLILKHAVQSTVKIFGFQSKMTSVDIRAIQLDVPMSEAYSLESVGKHGFGKCA